MRQPGLSASVAAAFVALGCHPSDQARRVDQSDRALSGDARKRVRDLDRALDDIEARLLRNRAAASLYAELAERHQKVSALACQNAELHAQGLALSTQRDRQARADLARHRLAEAAKSSAKSDATVTGYRSARPRAALPARTEDAPQ